MEIHEKQGLQYTDAVLYCAQDVSRDSRGVDFITFSSHISRFDNPYLAVPIASKTGRMVFYAQEAQRRKNQ